MRNKQIIFLFSILALVSAISGCVKENTLPPYTPNPALIFTIGSLVHTKDSVNIGDTVYLNAAGTVYDTTKSISAFLTSTFAGPQSGVFSYGSATAPIKVNRVIGTLNNNGNYNWTAILAFPAAAAASVVGHKTTLTISATYILPVMYSSQLPSSMAVTDAGTSSKNKTVYVK